MKQKITFREQFESSFEEVYTSFIISQTSKGVSPATIKNYHSHLKGISRHLDISAPFDSLTKRDLEAMVVSMRAAGLAHNSIATYVRVINTFLHWCHREGLSDLTAPNIREKETVKETYTDAELMILLKKPDRKLFNGILSVASVNDVQIGFAHYAAVIIFHNLTYMLAYVSYINNLQKRNISSLTSCFYLRIWLTGILYADIIDRKYRRKRKKRWVYCFLHLY